ncbi:hypothetical protein [Rhizobium leguminosarum]|uniref:hypothetical protein n=1 Tax=Rhizobium leguminosarum TaxID=384 RepID=UPI001FCC11C1|nr:hypothetical protein [Rhizobium leguminosarum]
MLDSAPFVDAAGRDQAAFDLERVPGISSSPWNICATRPLLAQFERLSEMPNQRANDDELRDIIDRKLTALIQEMEDADWSAKDVAFAIDDVLKSKWLDRMMALQDARDAVPKGFLSDGNEG